MKGSSNGTEYLVIISDEERTFKNDIDNNAYHTCNLHSFNKNLPYCQCTDQLPCKHMIAFTWGNLPLMVI